MVIPYNRLATAVEKVISYPEKGKRRKGQGFGYHQRMDASPFTKNLGSF
jgi:hypothetical protein